MPPRRTLKTPVRNPFRGNEVHDYRGGLTGASDAAGIYQLPFVGVGNYPLMVEKEGFKKYEQTGIALLAGEKAVIDVTLQLGSVAQSVSVTADVPVLNLESGDRGATISSVGLDRASRKTRRK